MKGKTQANTQDVQIRLDFKVFKLQRHGKCERDFRRVQCTQKKYKKKENMKKE